MLRTTISLTIFLSSISVADEFRLGDQIDPDLSVTLAIAIKDKNNLLADSARIELSERKIYFEHCPAIIEQAITKVRLKRAASERQHARTIRAREKLSDRGIPIGH